jgi:hypothetical protein
MTFDEDEATIAQHWATAIEYGDISGLSNREERQLSKWLKQWPSASFEYGEEVNFERCEISGLMADCIEVKIFMPVKARE